METRNREQAEAAQCIICEQKRREGITICSEFICSDCETEMVRTDVKDAKYPFFISQMRRIWYKKDA
ncbi:sigma factor G inhibitor Gin [Paenibacillus alkalitolerans]|uniref:sigma factor G inhibitor Gin n=1 Tax=Paenibacillus alkalitolerans TaxID=2799335 RepID=UPI0018F628E5|nr:sigma factor G inhibitor Gin [Paenibacillus alkalitolerans]